MTEEHKLMPCPIAGCRDNRITRGHESGPQLYFVQCTSPYHVVKIYGWSQEQADKRWNTPLPPTPNSEAVGKLKKALSDLMAACYKADLHEELSEFVDGSLLDNAEQALRLLEKENGGER